MLPNSTEKTEDVLSKDYNYKICYRLKLDEEKNWTTKRVILKLGENNQYCYAMTKPMPTGCIKKEPQPTWRSFNTQLERVGLNDPVGHLFVIDINFDYEKATPRQRIYNEIYPSIIEKQKLKDLCISSCNNTLEVVTENQNLIVPLKKHTQYCSKKDFNRFI